MISTESITIWRLQTNTGSGKIGKYCKEHNVVAMGWCVVGEQGEGTEGKSFNNYDEYKTWYEEKTGNKVGNSVSRLVNEMEINDLVWMRYDGVYYLGRVTGDWVFCSDHEAVANDACNQRAVEWITIGEQSDEISVPGAVSTSLIRGSTLQRIWKPGVKPYSTIAFNHYGGNKIYEKETLEFDAETFFSLLSTDDCEDLLYFYLYNENKYICVPSSDKKGTATYEYVMIDPENGQHVYAQVKQQEDVLDASSANYQNVSGKMYFFNGGKGSVTNIDESKNQIEVKKEELFDFVASDKSRNIVSKSISNWVAFLSGTDEAGNSLYDEEITGQKGVMFDTLAPEYEKDMLKNHKISAYGNSARFVRSAFNKGDYVFYYRKGVGIVAVGKILDNEPTTVDDEAYRKVELIYPDDICESATILSPPEIKRITNQNYYFASTIKSPYLNKEQSELLIEEFKKKMRL